MMEAGSQRRFNLAATDRVYLSIQFFQSQNYSLTNLS